MNGGSNADFHQQTGVPCFSEINSKYKHLTCRLCLCNSGSKGTLCDIYGSKVKKGWTAAAAISDLLGIEVSATDSYPQLVCFECLKKLCEFRRFKDLCLQAKLSFDMGLHSNAVLIHVVPEGRVNCGVQGITEEMSENYQSNHVNEQHPNYPMEAVIGNKFTSEFIIEEEHNQKSELRDPLSLDPEQDYVKQTLGESLTIKAEESQISDQINHLCLQTIQNNMEQPPGECVTIKTEEPKDGRTQLGVNDRDYKSEEFSFKDPRSNNFCKANILRINRKLDGNTLVKSRTVRDPSKISTKVKNKSSNGIISKSNTENSSEPMVAIAWKCEPCDKCFSERRYLQNHLRMIHEEKEIIQCNQCLKPCFGKKNLEKHMVVHSGKYPYNCELCKKGFLHKKSAEKHEQIHVGAPFKCDQCGLEAHSSSIIYKHIQKKHKVVYPCSMCTRKFSLQNELQMHFYLKHRKNIFQCSLCSQKFYKKESLDSHVRIHSHDWPFKCKLCQRAFTSEKSLQNHLSLRDCEEYPFKCDWCNRKFLHQGIADSHARMHDGAPFKCDHCGLEFVHIRVISEHIQKKHGYQRYCCSECPKKFFLKHDMVVHFQRRHTEKKFHCDNCTRRFHAKEMLEKHKRIHNRVRPFECKLCHRHFLRESFYHRHMNFHSKDVPFVCDGCGKEFNYKRKLRAHIRNVHLFKRHSCSICNRKFAVKSSLKNHMTIHTKERNTMCEICGKTFRQEQYLRIHRRTHTGEKPFCCGMCNKRFTQKCTLSTHIKLHCKKILNP